MALHYEELNDPFTTSFREICTYVKPEIKVTGFVSPKPILRYLQNLRDMEVRPDDTWVLGLPKCGTTWTTEMVWLLKNKLNFNEAKAVELRKRSPTLEHVCLWNPEEIDKLCIPDSLSKVINQESPRYIKSHLPFALLPKQLFESNRRYLIYVYRNPKDAAVSYYNHYKLWGGYKGSLEMFLEAFTRDGVTFGPFWDHVMPFWNLNKKDENTLFLTYEDMKRDLSKEMRKTADFLGVKYNDEQEKQLLDHLSFDSMKQNRAVNREDDRKAFSKEEGSFIRKGLVDGWKTEMSPEMSRKFDKWTEKNLRGSDFKLRTS